MSLILVVDDDFPNRYLLRVYLRHLGFESVEAENGKIAISQFIEHRPQLILMDIEMPVLNGREATKRIKEIEPRVPIIAVSGLPKKADISPFDCYIEKPYRLLKIEDVLVDFGFYSSEAMKGSSDASN
jgi:two-component system, cell cycle response regulator DivK